MSSALPESALAECGGNTTVVMNDYKRVPTTESMRTCKRSVEVEWGPAALDKSSKQRRVSAHLIGRMVSLANATHCSSKWLFSGKARMHWPHVARVPWPEGPGSFRKYALRGLPTVFTGAMPGSKLWSWNFTRLQAELGSLNVEVRHGEYGMLSGRQFISMKLSTVTAGTQTHVAISLQT